MHPIHLPQALVYLAYVSDGIVHQRVNINKHCVLGVYFLAKKVEDTFAQVDAVIIHGSVHHLAVHIDVGLAPSERAWSFQKRNLDPRPAG